MDTSIKVLCVDDSALVRKVLTDALNPIDDIDLLGCARDAFEARDMILAEKPDVLTLDIEMPRMDGITFLEKLMAKHPLPVVMLSSLTQHGGEMAMQALSKGAIDVMGKPATINGLRELGADLANKIRAAARADVQAQQRSGVISKTERNLPASTTTHQRDFVRHLLLLGASTGGTEALRQVFSELPSNTPGTLVVQHMPANFTRTFAESLNQISAMEVREAKDGDPVMQGVALVAPGGFHMVVDGTPNAMRVRLQDSAPVCHQKPAVDVLFASVPAVLAAESVAAVLTGMGHDGAEGIASLKGVGARTVAQDEASSVIYGMPRAAFETGKIDQVCSLQDIPAALLSLLAQR